MPCLFCESVIHLSENCDIHVTDESRVEVLATKQLCISCLKHKIRQCYHVGCEIQRKCYICFCKSHFSILCPFRKYSSKIFFPKIDANLHIRLFELCSLKEQYSFAFLISPQSSLFKFKPIKIRPNFSFSSWPYLTSDTIIYNDFKICKNFDRILSKNRQEFPSSKKNVILQPKVVILQNCSLSMYEILSILSPFTTKLKFEDVKIAPEFAMADIVKKAPNISTLEINLENSATQMGWLEDIVKFKNGMNLKSLKIVFNGFGDEINGKMLYELTTAKCAPDVKICFVSRQLELEQQLKKRLQPQLDIVFYTFDKSFHEQPIIEFSSLKHKALFNFTLAKNYRNESENAEK